jgi:hypothetical protein
MFRHRGHARDNRQYLVVNTSCFILLLQKEKKESYVLSSSIFTGIHICLRAGHQLRKFMLGRLQVPRNSVAVTHPIVPYSRLLGLTSARLFLICPSRDEQDISLATRMEDDPVVYYPSLYVKRTRIPSHSTSRFYLQESFSLFPTYQ